MTEAELLELVRAWRRYIEHLPGKHNQKSHGNKYGSPNALQANVKRLSFSALKTAGRCDILSASGNGGTCHLPVFYFMEAIR